MQDTKDIFVWGEIQPTGVQIEHSKTQKTGTLKF